MISHLFHILTLLAPKIRNNFGKSRDSGKYTTQRFNDFCFIFKLICTLFFIRKIAKKMQRSA